MMKRAEKILSVLLAILVAAVFLPYAVPVAKAYSWSSNWRYKTSENGAWIYPQNDALDYYDGTGFYWADFYGTDVNVTYDMASWHKDCGVRNGSTLIITNSNPSAGWPCLQNHSKKSNLFIVHGGGTMIVGEGIHLQNGGGCSAIAMEDGNKQNVYVAGYVQNYSDSQGVWSNSTASFHRLGRDNPFNNYSGNTSTTDYYKLTLNSGNGISSVSGPSDYLFAGRAFEPYLAQGKHFYQAGRN